MKKITLALITVLLLGLETIKAQEQELSASEPISSGCVSHSRGAEISTSPTIKLTKEENILSVELLNYTSNCGTTGFEVENKIIDGNNENPTVAINVTPVIPAYMDCTCPFNISYTVRDLEKNKFYLTCWWYEGQVELTEGEPLVLEYQTKDVVIDGLKFRLLKVSHQAILISQNTWDNNVTTLQIPSEVEYEGEKYTVTSVNQNVSFSKNSSITKIIIPKTVKNTDFGSNEGFKYNPFVDCFSVESIEVEEGNPAICSVDGVLFNKDTTTLIGYPAASARESYTVPASVKTAGDGAFFNSKYLKKIVLPDNIETLGYSLFASSKSLEEVTLPSSIKELSIYLFKDCTKLKSVVIPEGVTTIGYSAFEGCSRLESISLPESINFIDFFAFGSLSNLKNVYCQAKIVPNTSQNVFGNVNLSKVTLHVPAASISAYQATEPWKNFKEIVELPDQDDYHPFVENGKEWTMAYLGIVGPEYQHTFSYQQIKLGSAIEVDGITFKQIVKSSWQYDQDGPTNWKETTEYVGEADGKVYLYNQQTKNTIQVMDFTLKVGDTYRQTLTGDPKNGGWDFVVTAVKDTVIATSADKTPRKCLHLSLSDSKETDDVWVEGIGSLYGGVQGAYGRVKAGAISMLRICKADEQTLYEAYHPFLKEGKTWNYQEYYHNLWDDEQWTKDVSYVINGTTEIDGKTYYKMYRISEEGSKYYCALREEDRKVWLYTSDDGDQLLYDFGMSVGDSYTPSDESIRYQLTAIKPMRFQYYQLLNVLHYDVSEQYDPTEPYEYIGPEQIVEGVGCEKGWNIMELYAIVPPNGILHGENFLSCYEDGKCIFTADDFNGLKNTKPDNDMAYRPFVEEGKVWKVGTISGNPVQVVDYYYFDGDTIIGGRTCKQMMRQRYVSPDYPEYDNLAQLPTLSKVGAWYEKDKKVYFYNEKEQSFMIKYDFSIGANESLQLIDDYPSFIIGPRQTGEIDGFKGVYRDVMINQNVKSTTWLEGVGGIEGPTRNAYAEATDHMPEFLMSCAVGDEVIYLNEKYEDGATPGGARKDRFDFTHTIKTKPKAPKRSEDAQSLYGEYNNLQLGINLNPLDDTYQVSITNESGKVVYEKAINAGNIVGLNIDISAYAKGRYTVTVENSQESFTGEFETQTTGIEENVIIRKLKNVSIYNLQGQRINYLQKGLNIVNGKKVYVK